MATDARADATAGEQAPAVPPDVQEFRDAQVKEYGQYVAAAPIYVGNALAYAEGHPVPASNVKLHGYDKNGLVKKK